MIDTMVSYLSALYTWLLSSQYLWFVAALVYIGFQEIAVPYQSKRLKSNLTATMLTMGTYGALTLYFLKDATPGVLLGIGIWLARWTTTQELHYGKTYAKLLHLGWLLECIYRERPENDTKYDDIRELRKAWGEAYREQIGN